MVQLYDFHYGQTWFAYSRLVLYFTQMWSCLRAASLASLQYMNTQAVKHAAESNVYSWEWYLQGFFQKGNWRQLDRAGMGGTSGHSLCSEKRCLFLTQVTVYVLERYLLSSVPNQVLNSPSSLLNDACNRTRLQHRADKTTYSRRGHLDICSAWILAWHLWELFFLPTRQLSQKKGGGVLCLCKMAYQFSLWQYLR